VFSRVAKPLEGHSGPPGYHLALIFGTFLPWSVLLPMAIVFGWRHRADPRLRFALAAVLGPWVMFEAVQTKLPHYMLPAFPPLALLTADAIVRCLRGEADDLRRPAFRAAAAVLGAAVVALGVLTVALALTFGDPVAPPVVLALTTLAFAAAVVRAFHRQMLVPGLLTIGVGMAVVYAVLFGLYLPGAGALRISPRVADVLHRAGATGGPAGEALMLDYKEPSLAFYQGGTIREASAMALSHALLDRAPAWLVITDAVWAGTPDDVRARVEVTGSVRGIAYADGRVVEVKVIRRR
jgi:4-amino-4-deoxy-L-arabinose transferase-like glycosyltransferase